MKAKTRVLKINVEEKKITEIKLNHSLDIVGEIGNDCSIFSAPVYLDNGDCLYCDDEGLFHENIGAIIKEGWSYTICGNVLVVGTDVETGETVDAKSTIEELTDSILFIDKKNGLLMSYFARYN